MEFLKKYPLVLKIANTNRILSGEGRLVKNLKKICKNYGFVQTDLAECFSSTLSLITEREFALALAIELVDDSLEHCTYRKEKMAKLPEYLSEIIKSYNSIKR